MPSEPKILRLVIIRRGWEVEFDLALFLALRLVAGGWDLDNVMASFLACLWVIGRGREREFINCFFFISSFQVGCHREKMFWLYF